MQNQLNILKAIPAVIALLFPLGSLAAEPSQTDPANPGPAASPDPGVTPAVPSPQGEMMLPRVVVTGQQVKDSYGRPNSSVATKTDTPIMQTATKVEVLTQQAIKDLGLQSQGLGQGLAALGIAGLGMGDLGDSFFFRGFATTTTLWNGFRIEDMGTNANGVNGGVWMNNVERLELLRGASSILYGRAEPGGAISISTKKPLEQFSGSVDVGLGSYNNRWASADLAGPITADGNLLYRLNVGHEQEDSWYTYGPAYRSTGLAPALEYRLSPQTKVYFEAQLRDMKGGPNQPYMPIDSATHTIIDVEPKNTLMPGAQSEYKQRRAMLGVDHKFNEDWSVSWKYMHNKADNPLTIVSWVVGMHYPPETTSIEYTRGLTLNISGQKANATLLELTGKVDSGPVKHTLLFGMDYYNTTSFQNVGFDCWCNNFSYSNPPAYSYDPADFYTNGALSYYWTLKERELGFYAQDQMQLAHDVHLLIGGRYQRQKESSIFEPNEVRYDKNQFLPRLAALWQPVPKASLYYSYTENAGASQGLQVGGTAIEPEFSKQHEVGAKFDLLDGRLIAQAAVFELTKSNIAAADTANPGFNIAVGRVKSTGFELSLQGQSFQGLASRACLSTLAVET